MRTDSRSCIVKLDRYTAVVILTRGRVALIDADSVPLVQDRLWQAQCRHGHWYASAARKVNGKRVGILMHRLLTGVATETEVDHIDGDGLDNRRSNLRPCSDSQNAMNRKRHTNNTSGYKGVSRKHNKWHAQVMVRGRIVRIGYYATAIEAARAYDLAAKKWHGEFARTNGVSALVVPVRLRRSKSSRFVGVSLDNRCKMWRAEINFAGRSHSLGRYDTEEKARRAVLRAKRKRSLLFS